MDGSVWLSGVSLHQSLSFLSLRYSRQALIMHFILHFYCVYQCSNIPPVEVAFHASLSLVGAAECLQAEHQNQVPCFIVFGCSDWGELTRGQAFWHAVPFWKLTPCDRPSKPCKNVWGKRWWTRKTWVVDTRLVVRVLALLLQRSGRRLKLPVRWISDFFTVNFSLFFVPALLHIPFSASTFIYSPSNLLNTPFSSFCPVIDWKWTVCLPWCFRCVSETDNLQAVALNTVNTWKVPWRGSRGGFSRASSLQSVNTGPPQIILIYLYIWPKIWIFRSTVGFGEQWIVVQAGSVGGEMCCWKMRCMCAIMVETNMNESVVNNITFCCPSSLSGGRAEVGICMRVGFEMFPLIHRRCTLPQFIATNVNTVMWRQKWTCWSLVLRSALFVIFSYQTLIMRI